MIKAGYYYKNKKTGKKVFSHTLLDPKKYEIITMVRNKPIDDEDTTTKCQQKDIQPKKR